MKKFLVAFVLSFLACSSAAAETPKPAQECTPSMPENPAVKRIFAYSQQTATCEVFAVQPGDGAPASVLCIVTVCRMSCNADWALSPTTKPMCADINPYKGTL